MDEHDWSLYYSDIFKGGISVILYSRVKTIMYFVYHSSSLHKLIHHVGAHQHKPLMNQTQLPRSPDYHRMCTIEASNLAPPSATGLIYHFPDSQPNDDLRAWQLDATAEKMDQPYG
jgi:hypothetical protein